MNRRLLILLVLLVSCNGLIYGQQKSYLIGDNIAVFYPADFDATGNLPSFALLKEPVKTGDLPDSWTLRPAFSSDDSLSIASIITGKDISLYGTGEVTGPLLRNGQKIELWNTDNYMYGKANGKRLYQSHPWVLGVRKDGTSFGILADNTWRQTLYTGDTITFKSQGPPFRVIVIQRNTPQEVLSALADLTGKMPLPPLWALGFQQSRYSYQPASRVREIADSFRLEKIPSDVIWMDIDYMNGYRIFTFDPDKFPDPAALNKYLHQKKFHSIWMIDPGAKVDTSFFVYKEGSKGNYWVLDKNGKEFNGTVWPGECAFPDFTMPSARTWWAGLYRNFMATGIDGVWNDMNEPSVFNGPGGTMPETNIHRGGGGVPEGSHLRYHNVYGMQMIRATREGITEANPDKRPFILSRSNFLGGQRYAATWTGDNKSTMDHLKLSIPMVLTLGLSGQPFSGPDIGGFALDPTPELYARWIALGAFYPFSRAHSSVGTINQEPWAFGDTIENTARIALNRRYQLLPYLYTTFYETSQTGIPVMRPLFFADITNPELRDEQEAFLLGDNLMVIPRWARDVHLPDNGWTSVSIAGEDLQKNKYQPDVKIKDGAIVPLGQIIQSTDDYSTDSLTLLVAPNVNGKATGTLYIDSGDGYEYLKGEFLLYNFNASLGKDMLQVHVSLKDGQMKEPIHYYRLGFVSREGITYSDWQTGPDITMNIND
ncbi:MAG TPA: TIM-barrel domain-containing protein [Bacteroidales bacterium]|nr:TIM-barrel domain-containing protein [Bacteroidales bacterium]